MLWQGLFFENSMIITDHAPLASHLQCTCILSLILIYTPNLVQQNILSISIVVASRN